MTEHLKKLMLHESVDIKVIKAISDLVSNDAFSASWVGEEDTAPSKDAVYNAITIGNTHDGATLEFDGINSDGGAFSFTTTGQVTFNQDVSVPNLICTGNVDGVDISTISLSNQPTAASGNIDCNTQAITNVGNVDGVDVSALKTDVDGFPDELKNLVQAEIQQLENIGATTISAGQWTLLGGLSATLTASEVNNLDGFTGDTDDLNRFNESGRAQGDLLYASATNTLGWLAKGTDNYHFVMNGNVPNWEALDISHDTTPQLGGELDENEKGILITSSLSANTTYSGYVVDWTISGLTFGQCVYLSGNHTCSLADADASGTMPCVGLYVGTNRVLTHGSARYDSWSWTAGDRLYVGTDGNLTNTAPSGSGDYVQKVATATSATSVFFHGTLTEIKHA